jgi:lambda repressor-like predicted transcriptional regulator
MEMAAGARVPSEHLRALAKSAGLHGETLDDLCAEARRKIEAAFAEAFT